MADNEAAVLERLESAAETPPPPSEPVAKPEEPPVAEPAKEPVVPAETPSEGEAAEPEAEQDLDQQPENSGNFDKFKPVFESHPELKAELKQIIGREKAFSELGTFTEVRQIVERIPTLADAEEMADLAENHRSMGTTFREDPVGFVESLRESDTNAYAKLVRDMPKILAETDNAAFSEQARAYTNHVMHNALAWARSSNNESVANALATLHQAGIISFGESFAQPSAENSEAARLRQQLAERNRSDEEAAFNEYWQASDRDITNATVTELDKQFRQHFPKASEDDIKDMVKEGYGELMAMLQGQPQTRAQVASYEKMARSGKRGEADYRAIVNYGTSRAKLTMPKAIAPVVTKWSKRIVQANKREIDNKKGIAQNSRDAGQGPQGTSAAAAGAPAPKGKRSEEDIFRALESRTYVPPSR